jgi:hypothetical protein
VPERPNKPVHLTPKAEFRINIVFFERSWLFRNIVEAFGAGDRRRTPQLITQLCVVTDRTKQKKHKKQVKLIV